MKTQTQRNHRKAAATGLAAGILALWLLMTTFDYYWIWFYSHYQVLCPGGSIGIRI